jgi:hypothetical protein
MAGLDLQVLVYQVRGELFREYVEDEHALVL